jgi:hypothetical protein
VLSDGGADEMITVKQPSTKMGTDSDIGSGTLLLEERNPSPVGVQKPGASQTTELVVGIYPRRNDDRSGQAGCVPTTRHDKSRSRTGRDTEIAKTDRRVLAIAGIFQMMLALNETIGPEGPRVICGTATPDEQALGSFIRRKLKQLPFWISVSLCRLGMETARRSP